MFGILFDKYVDTMNYAPLLFAVVGAVGALPAVIGDLAASAPFLKTCSLILVSPFECSFILKENPA